MLFLQSVLIITLTGMASAGWVIEDTDSSYSVTLPRFTKTADAEKWAEEKSKKLESVLSTYSTHLTADPRYISAEKAFDEYVATRTDAPADILTDTNTKSITTYTTTPGWWKAMPTDIQEVYMSIAKDQNSMLISVLTDAAPKPTAMAKYAGAAAIAAGAAAAIL